ncbi:MAG TPA: hypothetical protein VFE28_02990 [Candidatus Krumholzibacteria bacterium]|jgi:hypothetical protein|nr:hypothetical protein [Candidatus Krumholzibacteria bacterium]
MLLGAGLSWMTITLSYVLLAWVWRRSRQLQVALVTAGFLVRVALLFGLLAWIARTFVVNLNQLVLWLVVFYFVLVVVEARELAAAERQRSREA